MPDLKGASIDDVCGGMDEAFLATRRELDPDGVFTSDALRRTLAA